MTWIRESSLQHSEDHYSSLFVHNPDGVYSLDRRGILVAVNSAIEGLTGYTATQLRGKSSARFIAAKDRRRAAEHFSESLRGEPQHYEMSVRRKGGDLVEVGMTQVPIVVSGEVVGVYGIAKDITERKKAEEAVRESERRFATLLANAPAYLYRCRNEPDWPNEFVSEYALELTGYTPQELTDGSVMFGDLIVDEDRERVWREVQAALSERQRFGMAYAIRRKDGTLRRVEERGQGVYLEDGEVEAIEGVVYDVTERKWSEAKLREADRRYHSLVENIPAVTYIQVPEREVGTYTTSYVSAQVRDVLGYPPQRFVEQQSFWDGLVHPEDRKLVRFEDERTDWTGEPFALDYRMVARDGRTVWVRDEAVLVRDREGEPLYWQGVLSDITARKTLEERLQHQALHDPLTGLPNRTLLKDRLRHALDRVKRSQSGVAVLFLDLDEFKVVNDSLGHEAGDQLLVLVAERLQGCLRPEDTAARLGGDEFVVLLDDVGNASEATIVAERIAAALVAPFEIRQREVVVTASMGINLADASVIKTPGDLLREADMAMYSAKRAGKARYEMFEKAMNVRALERLETGNDLRLALDRDELVVYYQPKVALADGRIKGFEALVRWEHPERGFLLPSDFIPLAEETGLIIPLGEAVLEKACRQARTWEGHQPSNDPSLTVCVNLSARQFHDPHLTRTVARVLAATGTDPRILELEITESTAMKDAPSSAATLEELKALGVALAIDDFGTGYSSLSYLERFFVDHVKVDRSFVGNMERERGTAVLVSAIIDLAHALGLGVIAEGVETAEQLGQLREMGCDFAQGFYLSKPVPPESVTGLLSRTRRGVEDTFG